MLCVTTGLALALLTFAAFSAAPEPLRWRPVAIGPGVVIAYLLLNRVLLRRAPRPPLVQADSPITLIFAGCLPLSLILLAVTAIIWPGRDYTLAVIVGAVFFGLTVESAVFPGQR